MAEFEGLAFPVVKVRYSGATDNRGARYLASCYRDRERTYRASLSYDTARSGGATQAVDAARACYAKALTAINSSDTVDDYLAIPGDLDARYYVFVMVPREYLSVRS